MPSLIAAMTVVIPILLPRCNLPIDKPRNADGQRPIFAPAPHSPFPAGKRPSDITVGDLNNDAKLDVITVNGDSKNVTALLGDGHGDFKPARGSPFKTAIRPEFIATGDLNRDGNLDLAIAPHSGGHSVVILLGDGKGGFRRAPNSPLVPLKSTSPHNHGLVVVDVNGDGNLDVVTANAGTNRGKPDNAVSVLLGNGRGAFRLAVGSPFKLGRLPASIALGDLNGDGKPDLAAASEGSKDLTVMLGDGKGAFNPTSGSPFSLRAYANSIAIGDVNNDDSPDLAVTHDDSSLLTILLGDGKGGFKIPLGSPFDLERHAWNIIVADVNRDKNMDLVTRGQYNSIMVWLGNGNGAFAPAPGSPFTVGTDPVSIAVSDVNADGRPDILAANSGSNNVTVLLGR